MSRVPATGRMRGWENWTCRELRSAECVQAPGLAGEVGFEACSSASLFVFGPWWLRDPELHHMSTSNGERIEQ